METPAAHVLCSARLDAQSVLGAVFPRTILETRNPLQLVCCAVYVWMPSLCWVQSFPGRSWKHGIPCSSCAVQCTSGCQSMPVVVFPRLMLETWNPLQLVCCAVHFWMQICADCSLSPADARKMESPAARVLCSAVLDAQICADCRGWQTAGSSRRSWPVAVGGRASLSALRLNSGGVTGRAEAQQRLLKTLTGQTAVLQRGAVWKRPKDRVWEHGAPPARQQRQVRCCCQNGMKRAAEHMEMQQHCLLKQFSNLVVREITLSRTTAQVTAEHKHFDNIVARQRNWNFPVHCTSHCRA